MGPTGVEAVRVRVTNVGRAAVSVESIALDIGLVDPRRPWKGRRSIVAAPFVKWDGTTQLGRKDSTAPERLEAGAIASRFFYLFPGISRETDRVKPQTLVVRGTATAAGRRRTLSPRRRAWEFGTDDETWFNSGYEVTRPVRVCRELWPYSQSPKIGPLPIEQIIIKLRTGASAEDIEAFLGEPTSVEQRVGFTLVAHRAHAAYHL